MTSPPFESLPLPPDADAEEARAMYAMLSANNKSVVAEVVGQWSRARAEWAMPAAGDKLVGFRLGVSNDSEMAPMQKFLNACRIPLP